MREIIVADEGDALGLGGEHVVVAVRRDALQQGGGAGHGELRVAEDDERADVQLVADLAQRQLPLQPGNLHGVCHGNDASSSRAVSGTASSCSYYNNWRKNVKRRRAHIAPPTKNQAFHARKK